MIGNTNPINLLSKLYLSNAISNDVYQELLLLLYLNSVPKTLLTQLIELWSQSANESIEWSDAVSPFDPEAQGSAWYYPQQKSISAGLSITF